MSAHFGERLGLILQERGIRPSKITRDLGISRQSLYNWLGGRNISAMNVGRLADYLGVDRLWLIEGVGSSNGMHDGEGVYGTQARALIENVVNNEIRLKLATRAAGLAIWEYDVFRDRLSWAGESYPLCQINLISAYPDLNSFIDALAEPDRESFSKRLKLQLHEGGQGFEELTIHLPDGCVRNIAIWLTTNEDAAGRPQGVTGAIQDITDRVQGQKALTESEAQLKLITDSLPALIAYVDSEQRYRFTNKEHERWYPPDAELCGKCVVEVMTEEDYKAISPYIDRALNGERVHYETALPCHDGSSRHVQVTYIPDNDGEGSVRGFFSLGHDISEQKRREEATSAREAQLRKAQEIAVLGKWELDVESRHCALSSSAMEIFGFSEGGDHSPDLMYNQIHPEDRDCWEQSFNAAISGLEDYDVHYRIVKPHGDIRHISAKAELVRDNNGRPTSMFGIVQDVTEQQRRERKLGRLNRTYEMLSRCNKSLIRAQSEEQLLNEFCDHIVATGGYRVAWVGCAKDDEEKTVEPVAVAGDSIGYVRKAQLTWADTPRGQGPGGRAIRTGKPVIIRDVRTDELFQPWCEVAFAQGYRSVTAFPLTANGNACGALFIYAEDTDAFDSEEVQLLENLAEDLSYGVHALRARRRRDEAEAELEESEQRFKDFAASASDWFWESDPDRRFTFLSDHFADSTGVSPELIIGKRCEELTAFDPNDANWSRHLQGLEERRPFKNFQFWHFAEDGRRICSRMSGIPIFDDKGGFLGYRGTAADVTTQVNTDEELRLAAAVFESTLEGVMVVTVDGTILAVNKAFTTITGYKEDEALGQKPSMLRSERHDSAFYATMWSAIHKDGHWSGEVWNRRKNGEVYPEWLNISSVKGEQGEVNRYVAVFSDITAMKQSEERLFHLAHHDPLTNLPNRLMFSVLLEHSLERVERIGEQIAVLFLDLDLFKNINDSFGHPTGDLLLQRVAKRLAATIRKEDTVARLGGDEFILLLEQVGDMQTAATIAEKLLHDLRQPFHINGQELYVAASVGISISPNDGTDGDMLIKNADAAMYRAKDRGRGSYCFYTEELTVSAMERVVLERGLRQALEQNQLVVYYQPQYSLLSGKLVGAEALVRWQHPEKGLIHPDNFIPAAEACGLILPLGDWVLRESSRQMSHWLQEGLDIERISVNVSGQQVERSDLVSIVREILEETGLQPQHLELEITESCIMREAESAIKSLAELKMMGVHLAVDDFGTGYSSLSYLKQLPIHKLKIDRSFIKDIPEDPNDEAISRAILALGHSLQLEIVAEGVETKVQEGFLKEGGCDEVQGYLYSRPLPAKEFEALIKAVSSAH
ncbi:MAG: EAL domain-containing protein [Candidatus Sedimenticola sp. (ex Thyasira tokunagai)]